MKNNATTYKNPFFSAFKIGSKTEEFDVISSTKASVKKEPLVDRRATSGSVSKTTQNVAGSILSSSSKPFNKLISGIEPSFLTKLLKTKQDTDAAFEALKKKVLQAPIP